MLVTATLAPDTASRDTRRSSCGARARERECASLDTRHRGSARTVAAAGATTTTTATTTTLRKPRRAREAPTRRAQIISAGRDRLPPLLPRSVAKRLACLRVCTYIQYLSSAVGLDLRERAKGRRVRGMERGGRLAAEPVTGGRREGNCGTASAPPTSSGKDNARINDPKLAGRMEMLLDPG